MIDFGLGSRLRPIDAIPLETLRQWRNDTKIWRWTRQNDLLTISHQNKWKDKVSEDKSTQMYSMFDVTDLPVGACGLTDINWQNRNAEFSFYIAPEHRGKGLATGALLTLFHHGFTNMGLHLIWGETFENNPAQGIFRKIGMHEEGRRREFYFKDGRYWDAILFSVTRGEFVRAHGERSCF